MPCTSFPAGIDIAEVLARTPSVRKMIRRRSEDMGRHAGYGRGWRSPWASACAGSGTVGAALIAVKVRSANSDQFRRATRAARGAVGALIDDFLYASWAGQGPHGINI